MKIVTLLNTSIQILGTYKKILQKLQLLMKYSTLSIEAVSEDSYMVVPAVKPPVALL
jgi:hypothetical protein